MRDFDFSPLYRSTIGFDRLARLLDTRASVDTSENSYPPYNIERLDENDYRITMAVAGFDQSEINIEAKENTLTISGLKAPQKEETQYLHRGIGARSFDRRFELADHVIVTGAALKNGLLHVELERQIPEEKKPRRIEIGAGADKTRTLAPKARTGEPAAA